jgi:hypothetical protein
VRDKNDSEDPDSQTGVLSSHTHDLTNRAARVHSFGQKKVKMAFCPCRRDCGQNAILSLAFPALSALLDPLYNCRPAPLDFSPHARLPAHLC